MNANNGWLHPKHSINHYSSNIADIVYRYKDRGVIVNHACCQCTEYKEPIPTNRSLPTARALYEHSYCFDEESLLLLFGDILKYFGCMSKDYNLKQCLLSVDVPQNA
eukprot:341806_1